MKHFILFLLLSCSLVAYGQKDITATLQKTDSLTVDTFVGMDNFGAAYTIKNDVLLKHKNAKEWSYKNLQLGSITSVDILNPLKITLFYKDFNTVIILDNTLNEIKRIDFNLSPDFKNLWIATTANDRNLWVFDTNTQQLEVFNYVQETTPIRNQPISEKIVAFKSNYNYCRILTESTLYTYNIYGSLLSQFPLKNATDFAMTNTEVIFLKEKKLYYKRNQDIQPVKLSTDQIDIKQFSLHEDILYIYDGVVLYQFRIKRPKNE